MQSAKVIVENEVGLQARPATFFIQKANEYIEYVLISNNADTNCQSNVKIKLATMSANNNTNPERTIFFKYSFCLEIISFSPNINSL